MAKNEKGQFIPKEVPARKGDSRAIGLLAMDFLGLSNRCSSNWELSAIRVPTPKAEHGRFQTSIANVFAAGDCRRGQSLVCGPSMKAAEPPASAIGF